MTRIVLFLIILTGLSVSQNIEIHGAIRSAMHGDLSSKFDLNEIKERDNIYGLGAVENLKGEITVINSRPYISSVQGEKVFIDSTFNNKAALFFFNAVQKWDSVLQQSALDPVSLQKILAQKAGQQNSPLTFLIEGKVDSLKWHVINWQEGDTLHTPERHRASGLHGVLKDQPVTIVGFYSEHLKGILTHFNSSLHMHFVNQDRTLSGHVDGLVMKEAVIKIGKMPSK